MKGKKRLSPFRELLKAIEDEVALCCYRSQLNEISHNKINVDFVLGYRCALNNLLGKAYSIYNRKWPADWIPLDLTSEEVTNYLLELLRKEGL